jgi:hypothetical protein
MIFVWKLPMWQYVFMPLSFSLSWLNDLNWTESWKVINSNKTQQVFELFKLLITWGWDNILMNLWANAVMEWLCHTYYINTSSYHMRLLYVHIWITHKGISSTCRWFYAQSFIIVIIYHIKWFCEYTFFFSETISQNLIT